MDFMGVVVNAPQDLRCIKVAMGEHQTAAYRSCLRKSA